MFRESIGLLRSNTLDCRQRHRSTGSNQGTHLFRNFAFDFFFAANVDVPTNQLGGEANVLSALADGEGELILVYDHFHLPILDVGNAYLVNFSRRQSISGKHRRLVRPLNNVDLFAAELANDGLDPRTFHAYASAHWIYVALVRGYRNLCAFTRFAHGRFDHNGAIVDFRNFHLE